MSKKYVPIIKEGTHLASSKETRGAVRGALLDDVTNKVVGQAEWKEIIEKSDSSIGTLGGAVIGAVLGATAVAGTVAIAKAVNENSEEMQEMSEKERIRVEIQMEEYRQRELRKSKKRMEREQVREEEREKRKAVIKKYLKLGIVYFFKGIWIVFKYTGVAILWVCKNFLRGVKIFCIWVYGKIRQNIIKRKSSKLAIKTSKEQNTNLSISPAKFSDIVDEAFEEFQKNMTSEEAQLHLLKILLLSNELATEIRAFSHAGMYNTTKLNHEYFEWQKAMEKLTTEKVAGYINFILENNAEKIESQMMNAVISNFYGGIYGKSQEFEPICQEKIKEVLRLY